MELKETLGLLNIDIVEGLFVEIFLIDLYAYTIRVANRRDGTCFYHTITENIVIPGGIIMWHGLLADIPASYTLCDGTNGTPDLRDKFVVGTPVGVDPGGVGGNVNHAHTFTGDGHFHGLGAGFGLTTGPDRDSITTTNPAIGTTDPEDGRPPFYAIAYIMKL